MFSFSSRSMRPMIGLQLVSHSLTDQNRKSDKHDAEVRRAVGTGPFGRDLLVRTSPMNR